MALVVLPACGGGSQPPSRGVEMSDAFVRLPPVEGRPGVAYFSLENEGPATTLLSITSTWVQRVEMHESRMEDGMMRMAPLPNVEIPANSTVEFKPGGKHVMLFGINPEAKSEGHVPLELTFRNGQRITAVARVVAFAAETPHKN